MGNKFSNKYIWVLMLVLGVFVMAVTALIGGNSSIRNAQQTAQRTLQYLQNQCISYRDIVAADRLKSLVRLTEQAQEVAERAGAVRPASARNLRAGAGQGSGDRVQLRCGHGLERLLHQ